MVGVSRLKGSYIIWQFYHKVSWDRETKLLLLKQVKRNQPQTLRNIHFPPNVAWALLLCAMTFKLQLLGVKFGAALGCTFPFKLNVSQKVLCVAWRHGVVSRKHGRRLSLWDDSIMEWEDGITADMRKVTLANTVLFVPSNWPCDI